MKGCLMIVATPVVPMVFGAISDMAWGEGGLGVALGIGVVLIMWMHAS